MSTLDEPKAVREGEQLDVERLSKWVLSQDLGVKGPVQVSQFPSGHSNLTYCVSDGAQEWVLRRPPFGAAVKTGHDMHREFTLLSALHPVWKKAPKAVAYCEDLEVMGAPFYMMERVQGVVLRGARPKPLADDPALLGKLCHTLVDTLLEIHGIDLEAAGLASFGKPEGYVKRQVEGWSGRYEKAATHEVSSMNEVALWLKDHQPLEVGGRLIHNDFRLDNMVLEPGDLSQIKAVLDWEMATLGDPMMDLGVALAYWTDPDDPPVMRMLAMTPTTLPGSLRRQEVWELYVTKSGLQVKNPVFYYVFGLFKVAVIAQQIYFRFHHGFTKDPRFAILIEGVKALGQAASLAIEKGRISGFG